MKEPKLTKEEIEQLQTQYFDSVKKIEDKLNVKPVQPNNEKQQRKDRALNDYSFFVQYYFEHYIEDNEGNITLPTKFHIDSVKAIEEGDNQQFFGAIVWPRGFAKSITHSLINPIRLILQGKVKNMLIFSKTLNDATRLLLNIQSEFETNKRLKEDFAPNGIFKTIGTWSKLQILIQGYDCLVTSYGREMDCRGIKNKKFRPDMIIMDDIDDQEIVLSKQRIQNVWDWITSSVINTCGKNYRIVCIENHYAKNSILTRFMNIPGCYISKVSALVQNKNGKMVSSWSEYYPTDFFIQKRKAIGNTAFEREYQNNPGASTGTIFKEHWINYKVMNLDDLPDDSRFLVSYIDPSLTATGDYKVMMTLAYDPKFQQYWVVDIFCRKCSIDEMYKAGIYKIYERYKSYPHWIYCESNFAQLKLVEQIETVSKQFGFKVPIMSDTNSNQKANKILRIEGMSPLFETGMIVFNAELKENNDFQSAIDMILSFSKSATYNDAPDCLESAIKKINLYITRYSSDDLIEERDSRVSWTLKNDPKTNNASSFWDNKKSYFGSPYKPDDYIDEYYDNDENPFKW